MRILATADLHYGLGRETEVCARQLARQVCSSDADLFLLGGDVAERSMESLRECLALFSDFGGPKLFVPGNHDFWIRSVSWENYREVFFSAGREHGFHLLDKTPRVIGPLGFIGNIGWFDVNDVGERGGLRAWAEGHRRATKRCLRWLRYHYGKVAPEADAVVCLLHHVPFLELTNGVDLTHFDLETETAGSERFGDLLLDLEKVQYVICGHLHAQKVFRAGDLTSFVVGGPNYDSVALLELETRSGHYEYTRFSAGDRS